MVYYWIVRNYIKGNWISIGSSDSVEFANHTTDIIFKVLFLDARSLFQIFESLGFAHAET